MTERWFRHGEPVLLDPIETHATFLSRAEMGEPPSPPETAPEPPAALVLVHDVTAAEPIAPLSLPERLRGLVDRLRRGDQSVRRELDALLHPEDPDDAA